ncbi:Uncharacterised protein [Kingella potus]|uniref:Uncharacterized protein n=1 Tax=Kingella potus TaxID=265175 RepID=A0A377R3M6_9NEIS|nr:hypothetical protein [Kingella potus]UOP00724.1 hypothetical protein LVJ84_13200 [Kingella potus]STR02879.1 Uncharacterised protein [Kingella potus]
MAHIIESHQHNGIFEALPKHTALLCAYADWVREAGQALSADTAAFLDGIHTGLDGKPLSEAV